MSCDLLPDVLDLGMKVVFCGTAAGRASVEAGSYYAHPSNKFWSVLAEIGLTDRKNRPHEFREVAKFGVGLTDLCKDEAGNDIDVRPTSAHRVVLAGKIEKYQPTFLAFTSIEAGKRYFGRNVVLGMQQHRIQSTMIYVLPSTSPMAAWNWEAHKHHWHDLASLINEESAKGDRCSV
ncbi:mismatch-specific DNA-glycosylase [Tardiphaga sp. 839_C3_N1_4]|jgi:TDG/mug DNA glycosylase family protein|uniref:mismatch-specific DNA-glycosylase n=1 Tax=Tardiphaga sp. 839_C3_N1_4 TaxID=3240761 RepID=UPI003F23AB3D